MSRILAFFALGFVLAFAQNEPKYDKTEGYLSDFARVVDTPSRIEIEDLCRSLQQRTGVQIAVVTIPTLNGEPIEDFTNTLARKWGVGQKGSNEGLMLLLAIQDRKTRTEVGYGLEPVLPDGYVGSVQRSMREELRAAKYGEAILKALRQYGKRIEDSKAGLPPPQQEPEFRGFRQPAFPFWMVFAIPLVFFVLILWLSNRGRRAGGYRGYHRSSGIDYFPTWPGGGFGGSSGGDSGGSSGGSDSGFGGFGGGDFGGGGASSDW